MAPPAGSSPGVGARGSLVVTSKRETASRQATIQKISQGDMVVRPYLDTWEIPALAGLAQVVSKFEHCVLHKASNVVHALLPVMVPDSP